MKKISLKLFFPLLSDCVLLSFHFFHPLWNLKFTGGQITKKWLALHDKWKIWIDTSWLVLYNALRFEKMQKRFISEHTFYINCFTLLISIDSFLLRLELIFEVFIMVLSVMKLKSLHLNKKVKQNILEIFYKQLVYQQLNSIL